MMNTSFMFIPSSDDDRDWILESYYQGYSKKNWSQSRKPFKIPDALTYISELSNNSSALPIIRAWIEWRDSQNKVKFTLSDQEKETDARHLLRTIQKNGILMDKDKGKYDIKTQSTRSKPFQIKHYARIFSIDGLKRSLGENGPALMILPIFKQDNEKNNFWSPSSHRTGGCDIVVAGYDKNGFILVKPSEEDEKSKTIIFPYEDWGMQWEVWTIIDSICQPPKNKVDQEHELNSLTKTLKQTPLKKKRFFKKIRKRKVHPAPPKKSNLMSNLMLEIKDSDSDSGSGSEWI